MTQVCGYRCINTGAEIEVDQHRSRSTIQGFCVCVCVCVAGSKLDCKVLDYRQKLMLEMPDCETVEQLKLQFD